MTTNGPRPAAAAGSSLPASAHSPAPYDGPTRDEVLAMRRE
jgi:hypothetical protein